VVLTDELLAQFPEADVRAGVLAHELGHVAGEHGLRQMYRSLGVAGLVALLAGETGPVLEDALLEGGVLLSLTHSRGHERAADAYGLALAEAAGYDPAGLVHFLERVAEDMGEGPSWASTHPATAGRVEAARRTIRTR
jgi:predicted Zn-dependent protease